MGNVIKIWKTKEASVGRDEIIDSLSKVELKDGEAWITVNTDKNHSCGWVDTTGIEDCVIWGKLNGRRGVAPLILSSLATKVQRVKTTNKLSMLCSTSNGVTYVKIAYYGYPTPSFPGAKFESDESVPFWRNHALILKEGDDVVIASKPTWASELF